MRLVKHRQALCEDTETHQDRQHLRGQLCREEARGEPTVHLYLLPIGEQPLEWKPQSHQPREHSASPLAAPLQESEGKTPDGTDSAQISPACGASAPPARTKREGSVWSFISAKLTAC